MKNIYVFVCVILFITACNNEIDENVHNRTQSGLSEVVLQVRDPSLPKEWSRKRTHTQLSTKAAWPVDQYIGRSYAIGNSIIGDGTNTRLPVLDYTKIKNEVTHDDWGRTNIDILTYANYDRFEQNIEVTKKVSSGFTLNLALFKIGRKNKFKEKLGQLHSSVARLTKRCTPIGIFLPGIY